MCGGGGSERIDLYVTLTLSRLALSTGETSMRGREAIITILRQTKLGDALAMTPTALISCFWWHQTSRCRRSPSCLPSRLCRSSISASHCAGCGGLCGAPDSGNGPVPLVVQVLGGFPHNGSQVGIPACQHISIGGQWQQGGWNSPECLDLAACMPG